MGRRKERETRKFGDWYEENKEALSKKRKKKYKEDKQYRESIKDRTNETYRKEHGILGDDMRIVTSDGEQFVAYKLGDAAEMLGTNITTLRWYSTAGYIPPFKLDGSPMRVITVDQLPLLEKFFDKVDTEAVSSVHLKMGNYLIKNWRKRNVSKKIISKEK